jgi:hypothetical protein
LTSRRRTCTPPCGAFSAASAAWAGAALPSSITNTASPSVLSRSTIAGIACQ